MDKSVETVDKLQRPGGKVLGIFVKEPRPGEVKTRLCPPLAPEEAAELYRAALAETVAAMERGGFEPVLCHAGGADFFRSAFPGARLLPQGEGDLGERMERALRRFLADGEAAALIGSDTPDLPAALVAEAFAALATAEVVTVPAADGGYVLIGERRHHPELFRDIPWSTPGVLAATRRRAAELAIPYREVGGWEDIDDLPSLRRLLRRSPACATARLGRRLLDRYGL